MSRASSVFDCVSLIDFLFSVASRKRLRSRVGTKHQVTKEDAMQWWVSVLASALQVDRANTLCRFETKWNDSYAKVIP